MTVWGHSALQPVVRGGDGTLIVSGATASLRGLPRSSGLASAEFDLRGLTQSMAREYEAAGVHVVLDSIIDIPRSRDLHSFDPSKTMKSDESAEAYRQLAHLPCSTRAHELDLRPAPERF